MRELALENISSYKNYLLMYVTTFEELLQNVAHILTSQATHMRDAILPGERLAVTLCFITQQTYTVMQVRPYTCHYMHMVVVSTIVGTEMLLYRWPTIHPT